MSFRLFQQCLNMVNVTSDMLQDVWCFGPGTSSETKKKSKQNDKSGRKDKRGKSEGELYQYK